MTEQTNVGGEPSPPASPPAAVRATGATPTPAPASPPPLAALDPAGTGTVISYQVPEPTSYDGRHIIALDDYVLADFAGVVPAPSAAPPAPVPPVPVPSPPAPPVQAAPVAPAADFEDTVNSENDTKASSSDATSASISADVGGSWGFAHADIKGGYSDQTNAGREQMAKNVQNALAKHASKASSNRSVNVNTDFSQTTSSGTTTNTSRTLKNINVSRVLNFVFRQMTQEHVVLTHLVDATLGYYKLDILLDANNQPQIGPDGGPLTQSSFTEYTLPEVAAFQRGEMTGTAMTTLQQDILNVLTNVSDINGTMQGLVELVTPKDSTGNPLPDDAYLRVKRSLISQYTGTGGAQYTVPGILLSATTCVLRTDQLLCDAILGDGDALDAYSHALQDVAIAERQAAVDERSTAMAREKLAQQIVASKDADMAAIWQKIFPVPLSVPATITLPATAADGAAGTAG